MKNKAFVIFLLSSTLFMCLILVLKMAPKSIVVTTIISNGGFRKLEMDDPMVIHEIRRNLIPPSKFSKVPSRIKYGNPSNGQIQALAPLLAMFGNTSESFYVDCGANDGLWGSNSFWLEKTLGWMGLLIEPGALAFPVLESRKRRAWLGNFCLSTTNFPSVRKFYQDGMQGLNSGLIRSLKDFAVFETMVPCYPLYSVLLAINRTVVHFFNLDVEGSEMQILRTIPFDKVLFKVLSIEHEHLREGKLGLRRFMESKGYVFLRTVITDGAGDSLYVHSSVKIPEATRKLIGFEDSDHMRGIRE